MIAIGVAVPVPNNQFREGTHFEGSLSSAVATDSEILPVDNDNLNYSVKDLDDALSMQIDKLVMKGDLIKIGASNDPEYKGLFDYGIVNSVSGNDITLTEDVTIPFATDDTFVGVGRAIAGGWVAEQFVPAGIHSLPLIATDTHDLSDFTNDAYHQRLTVAKADGGTGASVFKNTLSMDDDASDRSLMNDTTYRAGLYYRINFDSDIEVNDLPSNENTLQIAVSDGITDFINSTILSLSTLGNADMDDWHFHEITGSSTSSFSSYGEQNVRVIVDLTQNDLGDFSVILELDSMFLEHAKNTDGEDVGVYYLTSTGLTTGSEIYPLQGINWEQLDSLTSVTMGNGVKTNYNSMGVNYSRWAVTYNFSFVDEVFFKNIDALLSWQRKGYDLMLHTGIDDPVASNIVTGQNAEGVDELLDAEKITTTGLPPFIICRLDEGSIKRPTEDLTAKDVTLKFTEIPYGYRHKKNRII